MGDKKRVAGHVQQVVVLHSNNSGFPTGVANMGGAPQNLMGELKSKNGGAWGELKMLSKNTFEGVHLIVKVPAVRLQASKFTQNELLHTYFSRSLASC